jgi:putative transposase/transposase-like zinc-binding protein
MRPVHDHVGRPRHGSASYERRNPEQGVLYKVLQEHLETFLADAAEAHDGAGVPKFVEKELRAFLSCGVLARGFARCRCTDCGFERIVGLSCKGRGFCASCGGRRMTGLAADLTDYVIPFVPVRQFVLSVPHRLRYLLAYDHGRCIAVLRIFIRALMSFYRKRAAKRGIRNGRTGSVTFLQRFGSAANLNIHTHVIVLDGVFTEASDGELTFHRAEPPTQAELAELLAPIRTRILRYLGRRGLLDDDAANTDPLTDEAPVLASCYATSIGGRQAFGRRKGAKLQRIGADPDAPWVESLGPLQAQLDGFDLHAALAIPAQQGEGRPALEKLLRYCARPPIAQDRLSLLEDGRVVLELKTPWHDGSTHVIYEPLDFVAKLAALIPRPHKNLVLYHGVLAANAAWRARVVAYGRPQSMPDAAAHASTPTQTQAAGHPPDSSKPRRRRLWAELMRRAFGYDLLSCPNCGGTMELLSVILEPTAIRKILSHLGLPSEPPAIKGARASPAPLLPFDHVA